MNLVIERLQANEICLNSCYSNLMQSIREDNSIYIYKNVSELLYWIINTNDLLYSNHNEDYLASLNEKSEYNMDKLLLGLRFAFNANKHNMNIFGVTEEVIRDLTIFNFKEILWQGFPHYVPQKKEEKAFNAYVENIQGDVVLGILNITKTFLLDCIRKLK